MQNESNLRNQTKSQNCVLLSVIALALCLSLSACATHYVPSPQVTLPLPPSLSEPIPLESYLSRAAANIKAWQEALTVTP